MAMNTDCLARSIQRHIIFGWTIFPYVFYAEDTSNEIRFEGLHGGVTILWVCGDTISFDTKCGSEKSQLLNV
jgi:hypothetical protein